MKTLHIITIATLCGALSLAPSAMAQNSSTGSMSSNSAMSSNSNRTVSRTVDTTPERQESPNPWYLGLLGLGGLAGLLKKPQREIVRQTEVHTTTGTTGTGNTGGTPNVRQ